MELQKLHFFTATILNWQKLLKPDDFKDIVINSLKHLVSKSKIKVYGFVIMPNHIHFIWEMLEMNGKELPYASFIKFTGHQFLKNLKTNHPKVLPYLKLQLPQELINSGKAKFLRVPEIRSINLAGYSGRIGDKIIIRAIDDFKVESVSVLITNPDGTNVESGFAVMSDNGINWENTATVGNATFLGDKIRVQVTDMPENMVSEERTI